MVLNEGVCLFFMFLESSSPCKVWNEMFSPTVQMCGKDEKGGQEGSVEKTHEKCFYKSLFSSTNKNTYLIKMFQLVN